MAFRAHAYDSICNKSDSLIIILPYSHPWFKQEFFFPIVKEEDPNQNLSVSGGILPDPAGHFHSTDTFKCSGMMAAKGYSNAYIVACIFTIAKI